ncbi:MAG TPA: serine/threonine-protein kinase [Kofleriaceae bacterium]|nr:serine/threonine-protein kinase [Kofleriaceae bacterium]
MTPQCPSCGHDVLDIDVRCTSCGAPLGATGAHRMLGQVMLGQYELVDVLGQGGMSVVFKGKHKITEQEVALKILPPELAAHAQVKSRFLEEAKALAALDHPNIVHLYNFGQENGFFVLAMQFVSGRTWERMILEAKRLDWQSSCRICIDVLRALEYAHGRGVIHRDMKPSNVLVRAHDGSATVMDFGIAKMTTSTKLTATGQTMGTVRYMSPEQVRGQEVDLRTDIYSLGATLYESLVGETPFDGNTHFEIMTKHLSEPPKRPSTLGVEMPAAIEDALMRSLAKRADDRFGSAREMRKILEAELRSGDIGLVETQKLNRELLGDLKPTAPEGHKKKPPSTPPPTAPRPATANDLADELEPPAVGTRKRRSALPWILAGAVVIGAGVVGTLLVLDRDHPTTAKPSGPFPGLSLQPAQTFGSLAVTTDGAVAGDAVAKAYRDELAAVEKRVNEGLAKKKLGPVQLPDRIREIYAVPQSALCMKSAYVDGNPPGQCDALPFVIVIGDQRQPRLYVVSSRLGEGIERGVAQAVCDFQPDTSELAARICELAARSAPK